MVHVKKTLTGICLSFAMVTPIMAQTSVQEQAKTIFLRFQVAINHTLVMEEC